MRMRAITLMVVFMLTCAVAFAGAEELRESAYERYRGIWIADGIAVEIWRAEEAIQCRAVFSDGGNESDIREYATCFYEEAEEALQCFGVTHTRECFDALLDTIEELDWSIDDLSLAELRLSEGGLLFTDDKLKEPVTLTRLSEAENTQRNEALAFAGLWIGESCTLRAEDHGACYRFSVSVPIDDDTTNRWSYTCLYDPDSGRMASVNVSHRTVVTRDADGGTTEDEGDVVTGDVEFTLDGENRLVWMDMAGGTETALERFTS